MRVTSERNGLVGGTSRAVGVKALVSALRGTPRGTRVVQVGAALAVRVKFGANALPSTPRGTATRCERLGGGCSHSQLRRGTSGAVGVKALVSALRSTPRGTRLVGAAGAVGVEFGANSLIGAPRGAGSGFERLNGLQLG